VFKDSIRKAVEMASTRWDPRAPRAFERMKEELGRPGNRASVVLRFVDLMYAMSGENLDTHALINGRTRDDIDEGFETVLSFLRTLGNPGVRLARALCTADRG
jgi:hypothetical protein